QPPKREEKPDIKRDKTRESTPQFIRPDRETLPPQERIRERRPPEIQRESTPEPQPPKREEKPDIKRDKTRESTPQFIRPGIEREAPPIDRKNGAEKEKDVKSVEKDKQVEKLPPLEESVPKDRGFPPTRNR
ncbi:MAG: hypothetical protein N2511_02840, partial [Thermodesulfovibrionales bacterium]|nr:hypothetical protein [Thermodesulfovibrionales bacterium]